VLEWAAFAATAREAGPRLPAMTQGKQDGMTRTTYVTGGLGSEVSTPSGYYQPLEEALIDYGGRTILYTAGIACVEASCCGTGSWQYLRVEGYVIDNGAFADMSRANPAWPEAGEVRTVEIETVEDSEQRAAIDKLLLERHPGARIEFR
jgi:hypothetical protein